MKWLKEFFNPKPRYVAEIAGVGNEWSGGKDVNFVTYTIAKRVRLIFWIIHAPFTSKKMKLDQVNELLAQLNKE